MTETDAQSPRRRGWTWPAIIVALIGLQIGMSLTALALAVGDPTQAVVPDYYRRAVAWDEHRASLREAAALGWSASVRLAPASTQGAPLTIRLTDRTGGPVVVDSIEATLFHHARASRVQRVAMRPTEEPGDYTADADVDRPGHWQVDIVARRGAERFETSVEIDLAGAAP